QTTESKHEARKMRANFTNPEGDGAPIFPALDGSAIVPAPPAGIDQAADVKAPIRPKRDRHRAEKCLIARDRAHVFIAERIRRALISVADALQAQAYELARWVIRADDLTSERTETLRD